MADQPLKLLSIREACMRTSLSRTSLYHAVVAGTFPQPLQIGPGRKAFLESEVEAWIRQRIQARDEAA